MTSEPVALLAGTARLADEVSTVMATARARGLDAPFLDRLASARIERASECLKLLTAGVGGPTPVTGSADERRG